MYQRAQQKGKSEGRRERGDLLLLVHAVGQADLQRAIRWQRGD